jgi:hypothetical protein
MQSDQVTGEAARYIRKFFFAFIMVKKDCVLCKFSLLRNECILILDS